MIKAYKNLKQSLQIHAGLFILFLGIASSFSGCSCIMNSIVFHPSDTILIKEEEIPDNVHELYITTKDDVTLQTFYVKSRRKSRGIILYFHGNGGNAYGRLPDAHKLSSYSYDVLLLSYRGYGKSEGSPSEEGIYEDGFTVYRYAQETLGYKTDQIILYGRSLGSTVAVHLGQHRNIRGIILVTPLTNAREMARVYRFNTIGRIAGDSYNSLAKIKNVTAPVLILHGSHDRVIPPCMGFKLYNACKSKKKYIFIEGAGHNDISLFKRKLFWASIRDFLK